MHKKGRRTIVERNKSIELFACVTPAHVLSIGDDVYQSDPLNPIQSLKESTKQRARASAVFPESMDLE
jgi:hypothetical protein